MSPWIEYTLVGLIVASAAIAVGLRVWRFWSEAKPGCGSSCGGCSTKTQGVSKPLVQLQTPVVRENG